jgi:hypothetical protein
VIGLAVDARRGTPLDRTAPPPAETPDPAAPTAQGPERLPEAQWLHQPQWARVRRAATTPGGDCGRLLVVVTDGPAITS